MLCQEARDQGLADRAQAASFPGQPMGEVRNAAQIDTLGARGIPPTAQVRAKSRNVRLNNAVLQPHAGLRMDDDHLGHVDLLSGRTNPRGDQDYAQFVVPKIAGESALQVLRSAGCA
jgi:hypothetical protein